MERIERYFSYFENQLEQIQKIEGRLHQKILLMAILDTLARVRHPTATGNKERFLQLVRSSGNWPDAERISLYQLSLSFSPAAQSQLKETAWATVNKWRDGSMPGLDVDPLITDLNLISPTSEEQAAVANCRHLNLLYTYRNYLVQEFREPGHGGEMNHKDTSPYYYALTHLNQFDKTQRKDTWELVYPVGFFTSLAITCLNNAGKYLRKNNLDPYSFYEFGTMWKRV